jgi:hypothetical protein
MVLMDINASNMSGVICTSQLKENFCPSMPIFMPAVCDLFQFSVRINLVACLQRMQPVEHIVPP